MQDIIRPNQASAEFGYAQLLIIISDWIRVVALFSWQILPIIIGRVMLALLRH